MSVSYPVLAVLPDVRRSLEHSGIALLQASPGAGKSTVLPLYLLDEPWLQGRKIIMLQPRRLAAKAVAHRLAEQLGEVPGERVGYRIRLETCLSRRTRIEVVTEGILARMLQSDPGLEEAGLLIFDEFHERSIHADVALAFALHTRQLLRPDLRILIMSATLPAKALLQPLYNPPVIQTPDRSFPVEIVYDERPVQETIWQRAASAVRRALREHTGDILVFLPGAREITRAAELLTEARVGALVCPLYGELPLNRQQQAILPDALGRRKVVLATNLAETSLTIEGVRVVIDSGFVRQPVYDPRSGLAQLETQRITLDSAEQRAGRAGRTAPGVCYRLWTKATHEQLRPERRPEIEETDLASVVLLALDWGVKDVYELPWITPPPAGAVAQSFELLKSLGAVDEQGLTPRGRKMASLSAHPRIAHLLTMDFASAVQAALAADIAALLEERDILRGSTESDFVLRIETLRKFRGNQSISTESAVVQRVARLAAQWRKVLGVAENNDAVNSREVGYLLLQAYPDRIACRLKPGSSRYRLRTGRVVYLDDKDPLTSWKWIVAAHAEAGPTEGKVVLAAGVEESDLYDLAVSSETVQWDEHREMITAVCEHRLGTLLLRSTPVAEVSPEQRQKVLCSLIRDKGIGWLGWNEDHDQWCNRVMSLKKWRPDEGWPDVSMPVLMARLETWLSPFLVGVHRKEDFKQIELMDALNALLPADLLRIFERLAPAKIVVPTGSRIKVHYKSDGSAPHVEVRLQECFGLMQTPSVNDGRTSVVLHLLSPGFKPVQVTQDLPSFWRNTYPAIRKELMRRYPKHAWPENPETAQPVRGVVRKPQ